MKSGEKRLTQQQILGISFVFAIAMMYFAIILPSKIGEDHPSMMGNDDVPTDNSSTEPSPDLPNNPSVQEPDKIPSQVTEPSETLPSQPMLPIPVVGTSGVNLPNNFIVGPWHDHSCGFNLLQKYVDITGVEIYGGTPPFIFSFQQSGEEIANFELDPQEGYVKFTKAVRVKRGSYVHVIIKFQSPSGSSEWRDDLMYLNNILCSEP